MSEAAEAAELLILDALEREPCDDCNDEVCVIARRLRAGIAALEAENARLREELAAAGTALAVACDELDQAGCAVASSDAAVAANAALAAAAPAAEEPCGHRMRGIYGAETTCARAKGHLGEHDPIWTPAAEEAKLPLVCDHRDCAGFGTRHEGLHWKKARPLSGGTGAEEKP